MREGARDGLIRSLEIAAKLFFGEFRGGVEHAVTGPSAVVEVQSKSVGGSRHILSIISLASGERETMVLCEYLDYSPHS
jgi:hypothetical protein